MEFERRNDLLAEGGAIPVARGRQSATDAQGRRHEERCGTEDALPQTRTSGFVGAPGDQLRARGAARLVTAPGCPAQRERGDRPARRRGEEHLNVAEGDRESEKRGDWHQTDGRAAETKGGGDGQG